MTPQFTSQGQEDWPARSFLGGLSEPVRSKLLGIGTRCRYLPGEVLIREGDRSNHVVLLRSGFVKVTASLDNGHEALLAIRVGGDIVGEMAAMDDGAPRSATVTACGEIAASMVRESDLRFFLESHPEAARAVNRIVIQRLRWSNQRRVEFGGYSVKVRLARVLAELAASYGHPVPRGIVIGVNLTQPELAALTGSAEVTIHKALAELRRDGLITTGYRRTTVLDVNRLRETARLRKAAP
ncbi:Crp/Fnr family transcriptional regulator [Streptomyces sp. TG1A-8]|uniref:Crp/Fnr family transcriptional regulator n=1 Tax=Streptomyces sp. TG1A-8 TaxID=3051385 RepID=UPI00265C23FF|nr:Crp/Fnr family transcriptional regulator [Streptomyces sp. TG1A-8]MDO0927233.1 Crp/Fnr family transcriptional regulator [Streptomyces sp. TG1A-8]